MSEEIGLQGIAAILKAEGIVRFFWKAAEPSAVREVLMTMHTPRLSLKGKMEPASDYVIGIRRLNMVAISRGIALDVETARRFFGGERHRSPPETDMPLSDNEVACFVITVNMIRVKAEALASGKTWEGEPESAPGVFTLSLPE